ncbi:hypothetical protein NERG_02059 [Nematocida ausubeli]|uniref:Uncharacterized protein n=1 Tax=Nematocida ausubeli (strain ATCC PRA-371 / ERTm2) TaxID=1913371 RepID=H8ZEN8_NEMA1|nr:hypothetical protein NERG_02059 [Nematocida ausubeli]
MSRSLLICLLCLMTFFQMHVLGGGVIVDDPSVRNDVVIEKHTRVVDDYFILRRCIDTFCVRNAGDGVIKGIYIPSEKISHLSYYDELGSIHKRVIRNGLFLLGFRYSVKPMERISFSVETVYTGPGKSQNIFDTTGVWPFESILPLKHSMTHTYFNMFTRKIGLNV